MARRSDTCTDLEPTPLSLDPNCLIIFLFCVQSPLPEIFTPVLQPTSLASAMQSNGNTLLYSFVVCWWVRSTCYMHEKLAPYSSTWTKGAHVICTNLLWVSLWHKCRLHWWRSSAHACQISIASATFICQGLYTGIDIFAPIRRAYCSVSLHSTEGNYN